MGDESETRSKLSINKQYVPLKLTYFFFMAGEGCFFPFRPLFIKHIGLSSAQAGIIWCFERIIALASPPLLGALTDKSQRPKIIIILFVIIASIFAPSMYFIPVEKDQVVQNNCDMGNSAIGHQSTCKNTTVQNATVLFVHDICEKGKRRQFVVPKKYFVNSSEILPYQMFCDNKYLTIMYESKHLEFFAELVQIDSNSTNCFSPNETELPVILCDCPDPILNKTDDYGATFWLTVILIFIISTSIFGAKPIIESSVLKVLGEKNRHKLGQQRLFASIGYGSAAFLIGVLKDNSSPSSNTNREFLSMFVGVFICWVVDSAVNYKLPIEAPESKSTFTAKEFKKIFFRAKFLAYLFICTSFGMSLAAQEIFLFWMAEVKLNAPARILGLTILLGAIADIPFCLMAGRLIRKFGHNRIMIFCMLIMGVRLLSYKFVTEAWQLIPVELLRAITWGLASVVICSYTAKISPIGLESSTMGIVQAVIWGFGYSIGALLSGYLFGLLGGDAMFLLFSMWQFVATIIYAIFCVCIESNKEKDYNAAEEVLEMSEIPDEKQVIRLNDEKRVQYLNSPRTPRTHRHHALLENLALPTPTSSNMSLNFA